jgi:hypothetical protein
MLEQMMTMETRLMMSLARPRLYAVLLGGFATFALVIAVIGLFGDLSCGVTQRTWEIGVRTALRLAGHPLRQPCSTSRLSAVHPTHILIHEAFTTGFRPVGRVVQA